MELEKHAKRDSREGNKFGGKLEQCSNCLRKIREIVFLLLWKKKINIFQLVTAFSTAEKQLIIWTKER